METDRKEEKEKAPNMSLTPLGPLPKNGVPIQKTRLNTCDLTFATRDTLRRHHDTVHEHLHHSFSGTFAVAAAAGDLSGVPFHPAAVCAVLPTAAVVVDAAAKAIAAEMNFEDGLL